MRRYALCLAALLLAAPSARAGELAAAAPPAATPPAADAATLYNQGRYLEAARAFEDQWRQVGDAGILFNAGLAREAAGPGNDALALVHWQRFLATASNVTDAERTDLERRSEAARGRMAILELVYQGPPDEHPEGVTLRRYGADEADRLEIEWPADQASLQIHVDLDSWTVQPRGHAGAEQRLRFTARSASDKAIRLVVSGAQAQALPASPVEVTLGPKRALTQGVELTWEGPTSSGEAPAPVNTHEPSHTATLAPGPWTLRASADGFETEKRLVNVLNRPVRVDLKLKLGPMEKARIGLAVGMGVAGVGLLAGGVAAFPRYDDESTDPIGDYKTSGMGAEAAQAHHVALRKSLALIGAGVGLAIPAATVGLRGKTRAYAIEAALGGVFVVAGAALLGSSVGCDTWLETATKCHPTGVSGGAALGLGAGLLGGASLTLATHAVLKKRGHKHKNAKRSPQLGANGNRHGASLSLSGRF